MNADESGITITRELMSTPASGSWIYFVATAVKVGREHMLLKKAPADLTEESQQKIMVQMGKELRSNFKP